MPLPLLTDTALLPARVPVYCPECRAYEAKLWIVSPDGVICGKGCRAHAQTAVEGLRKATGNAWTAAAIYHDEPTQNAIPRTTP